MSMIKVHIVPSLLTKLDILSSEYSIEVGGYLIGEVKDGMIILQDLLIPDQAINSVHVGISPQDQVNLVRKYGFAKCKKIIGHWHSHHHMGCFWSGTDRQNMENIVEEKKNSKDVFVFIVSSNKNHLIRVSLLRPIRVDFENVDLTLKSLTIDLMKKQVDNIIRKNTGSYVFKNKFEDEDKDDEDNDEQLNSEDDD